MNVLEFYDGAQAFEYFVKHNKKLSNKSITLMILDQNMPNMLGSECTLKIKQKVTQGYQNCVIIGHSSDDSK